MAMSSLLVNPYYASTNQDDIIAKSYTKTQTAFDSNTCMIEGDNSTNSLNCANINPQTLGERNFVDVDNSQSSAIEQKDEQGAPGPPGPPGPQGEKDLVHVVWEDHSMMTSEIEYKRDGAGFDPTTLNLSNDEGVSERSAIAVSGQNVYVVWADIAPSPTFDQEIFYKKSTDGGATFSPTENISNDPGLSQFPAIAVSGQNVYIVWENGPGIDQSGSREIFYKKSTNGGDTFESTQNISNNDGTSRRPEIASSGNNVYVVWEDTSPGNRDIFYRKSADGGAIFGDIINLSDNVGRSDLPAIAVSGNNVYVVWDDSTPGNEEIFYKRSSDGGAIFGITLNLSNNEQESASPAIAASANNVYVVWKDELPPFDPFGNAEIFYRRSTDSGALFGPIENLSNNKGGSSVPSIAAFENNVHLVWADNSSGNSEILYSISTNNGATFSSVLTNISNNNGNSNIPDIAVSNPVQ